MEIIIVLKGGSGDVPIHSFTACCAKMAEKLADDIYRVVTVKGQPNRYAFRLGSSEMSFCPSCGKPIKIVAKKQHQLERRAGQ